MGTTERLHFPFSLSCIGERNSNPLQCSCLENPRDGGPLWAAVYGVAQSRTWLKRLSRIVKYWSGKIYSEMMAFLLFLKWSIIDFVSTLMRMIQTRESLQIHNWGSSKWDIHFTISSFILGIHIEKKINRLKLYANKHYFIIISFPMR